MKKFVIVTDSCSDLTKEWREKYDIEYIPMHVSYDGKDMDADLDWREKSVSEFYDMMRQGTRFTTSQVNATQFRERYEQYIQAGYDILYVACSSGLSASVKASELVSTELLQKYPDAKIVSVDSLNACMGLGLLCIRASELRAEGKTIDEVAEWIRQNRLTMNQECTVEKLTYLKQAGRVSAASAFFGGLLQIKPIIISDIGGRNAAVEKVKGRKTSIERIAQRFKEEYKSVPYQKIFVTHADCIEDAEALKEAVLRVCPDKDMEIPIVPIGPTVGASAGPGTIAVYFYGQEVVFDGK